MKTLLKFLLSVACLMVTFILTSTVLYAHTFKETSIGIQTPDIIYLAISSFWICLLIWYVVQTSHSSPKKTAFSLCFSLFFIYAVMTQIRPLVFDRSYVSSDFIDILSIIMGNAIPVIIAVLVGIKLFRNHFRPSKYSREPKNMTFVSILVKLFLTGLAYLIIYFVFGYFIFWRLGATHIFYNGDNHSTGFIAKIVETWNETPQVYLIEFARGLLYGIFVLPLINMFKRRPLALFITLALTLETPAIYLIIPSFLFPDTIRTGHLWETASTLALFALATWLIFDKIKISEQD